MRKQIFICWAIGFLLGCLLFCTVGRAEASETPIWDNLLQALFVEGGGSLEWAPDPKDGYGTAMHLEPRYTLGGGFSFDATDALEVGLGYRWTAMPPIPGHGPDPADCSHTLYLELRYTPFRK